MVFAADIDATPALSDKDIYHAPAIRAGERMDRKHLLAAEREERDREQALLQGRGSVTDADIYASKKRKVAIAFADAYETYGDAMTGARVTNAQLVAALADQSNYIAASIAAESARRYNANLMSSSDAPFRRIPKTVANTTPLPEGIPDAAIGDRCPANIFPVSQAAVKTMSLEAIDALCAWYNQDMGIVAEDTLEQKRSKVLEFVYWGDKVVTLSIGPFPLNLIIKDFVKSIEM